MYEQNSQPRPNGSPRGRPSRRYSCLIIAGVLLFLLVVAIIIIAFLRARYGKPVGAPTGGAIKTAPAPAPGAALPEMAAKPRPVPGSYKGCPPEGDGGDPALNRLKNRIDEGQYVPVNFEAIAALNWPENTERTRRANWAQADATAIARYEGLPVSIEGYVASSKQEGPESPNCHGADADFRDFHIWITPAAENDRSRAIVVEMTPPVRANHPRWRTDVLGRIARADLRVRVSGWLMFDPEHPDQVGKTRATIWEIHPVMKFEVQQNGRWVALDDYSG